MKLNFGSEAIMLVFILGLAYFTVLQPTFYPSSYSTSPATEPTLTPTPPVSKPTPTPTPAGGGGANPAFFTIIPSVSTIKKGETLPLSLSLTTGDFEIDSVDLILKFNPMFFKINSVQKGSVLPQYPVQKIEGNKITVSAAAEIQDGQVVGFKGEGEYVKIIFQALAVTDSTQITFDSNSVAAGAGINRLNLDKCQPGDYQITD